VGVRDLLRRSQPPRSPRGASGRGNRWGFLNQDEENFELLFPSGLRTFDKMYRTDPDVRRNIWMVANPIIGATWSVEPFGGDEAEEKDKKAAEFVKWALFEQMRPRFKGHLAQALPVAMRSGFAPFEQIWTSAEYEGKQVLIPKTLGLRLPRTILRFNQEDEELVSLEQLTTEVGTVTLPAADLVYYRFGAEGDNWEGISLLRAAYKPWLLKEKLEKIDAIKQERQATGIPVCYPPAGKTDDQVLDEIEDMLAGLRTAEQSYIVAPGPHAQDVDGNGWRFEILSQNAEKTSDVHPSLEYHSDKIAAAFLAEFMRLGQGTGAVGARATADVQQNPFLAAVEAIASELEAVLNESLIARMAALNFEVDEPPKLVMSLVDSTSLTELADYVKKLIDAGALHPDADLEDFLRDRGDLPPEDPKARKEREEAAKRAREEPPPPPDPGKPPPEPDPDQPPPPAPRPQPVPPQPERQPRELRWWEEAMELDTIETAIAAARTRFEEGAGEEARAVVRDLVDTALAGRQPTPRPSSELTDAIRGELDELYGIGRDTVGRELDAQRRRLQDAPGPKPSRASLKALAQRAGLAAQSITSRIWQSISQTVLAGGDAAAAQAAGEAEAGAALRAEAQLHAAGALNLGRQDEADAHAEEIRGSRYTSILDTNRCEQCAVADDDVLRPLDDPVRLKRRPPNPDCYGGHRCRCMEFYELREEEPGYGGAPAPVDVPPPGSAVAEHFDVTGGSAATRQLVADQMAAVEGVHSFPEGLPTVPVEIKQMAPGMFGRWEGRYEARSDEVVEEKITLNQNALNAEPPITSTVHEIGHYLDAHGFGSGPNPEMVIGRFASSTQALAEWRQAVTTSQAYQELVNAGGTAYTTSIPELLARSYEQWIAERSGNEVLGAKIRARLSDHPHLYWEDEDFRPIAEALDRLFATRGLR
jgi:hypothetical protein